VFLSQTAEYALRAMAWMVANAPDEPVRVADLSIGAQIPAHYLAKILRRLVLAGLLESRKGRTGGFRLALPPGKIRFRDILEAVDALPDRERCAFGWGDCDSSHPCPLHVPWTRMSAALHDWAAKTTLAEVGRSTGSRAPRRGTRRGSARAARARRR